MKSVVVIAFVLILSCTVSAQSVLHNDDVIALKRAAISDNIILLKIENSAGRFDTGTSELIRLRNEGLPDMIISAMVKAGGGRSAATNSAANNAAATPATPKTERVGDFGRPTFEVFGGYSFQRHNGANMHGWEASFAANVTDWFAIVGDVDNHYYREDFVPNINLLTYSVGPKFTLRASQRVQPFAQVLFGRTHAAPAGSFGSFFSPLSVSVNPLAGSVGAGLDVVANRRIAVRVIQLDLHANRFDGETTTGVRASTGLVFRF